MFLHLSRIPDTSRPTFLGNADDWLGLEEEGGAVCVTTTATLYRYCYRITDMYLRYGSIVEKNFMHGSVRLGCVRYIVQ